MQTAVRAKTAVQAEQRTTTAMVQFSRDYIALMQEVKAKLVVVQDAAGDGRWALYERAAPEGAPPLLSGTAEWKPTLLGGENWDRPCSGDYREALRILEGR